MYALDVPTLTLTLDTVNPGDVSSWIFDYDFKIKVSCSKLQQQQQHPAASNAV